MTNGESQFWDDLSRELEDPDFREAFGRASDEIAKGDEERKEVDSRKPAGDAQELDQLMRDAKPYGSGEDLAIPGFFESDEEQQEFVRWVRAERDRGFSRPPGHKGGTVPGFDRLTVEPDKLGGRPCIRGYRFSARQLLELMAAGQTFDDIREHFDFLEPEDVRQVLGFAAALVDQDF